MPRPSASPPRPWAGRAPALPPALRLFPGSGRALRAEINYFVLFNVAAFPLVWGASVFLADYALPELGISLHVREIAHAIAIALPLVLNFYLHKFITFREMEGETNNE
jgi:hypothetical protein